MTRSKTSAPFFFKGQSFEKTSDQAKIFILL